MIEILEIVKGELKMGATIPASIQPGSIDHVPYPTVLPCLGVSSALGESPPKMKSLRRISYVSILPGVGQKF